MAATSKRKDVDIDRTAVVDIDDEVAVRREIKLALLDIIRTATKPTSHSIECEIHPKYKGDGRGYKHKVIVPVKDASAVVSACKELLNRLEGTPGQRREKPKPKSTNYDEMTDEQLQALLEVDHGEADLSSS